MASMAGDINGILGVRIELASLLGWKKKKYRRKMYRANTCPRNLGSVFRQKQGVYSPRLVRSAITHGSSGLAILCLISKGKKKRGDDRKSWQSYDVKSKNGENEVGQHTFIRKKKENRIRCKHARFGKNSDKNTERKKKLGLFRTKFSPRPSVACGFVGGGKCFGHDKQGHFRRSCRPNERM